MFVGGAHRVSSVLHAWFLTRTDGPWRVHHEFTVNAKGHEAGRVDLWALRASWARLEAWAFEIKVSKSDFRQDVDAGKWRKYLGASSRFFWAVPEGLITKDEIPEGTGLVYVGGGVKVVVRSPIRKWQPSWQQLASRLFSIETPMQEHAYRYRSSPPVALAPVEVRKQDRLDAICRRKTERAAKKKDIDEFLSELSTKSRELKQLEQLKADDYKKRRMLEVVGRELGMWSGVLGMTEDDLGAALRRYKDGVNTRAKRQFETLAKELGFDLVERPRSST